MSEVNINIPQQLIDDIVRAEVIRSLGKTDELIKGIVQAALSQKRESWNRQTILQEEANKLIHEVAVETFKNWLDENKPKIRAAMLKALNDNKQQQIKDFVDATLESIEKGYRFRVTLDIKDE